jgi:hypothetical protein
MKNGNQIYRNLSFIKTLLVNSVTRYGEAKKLAQKYNIIGIVLNAADAYMNKVSKSFNKAYDLSDIDFIEDYLKEKQLPIMDGKSHRDNIEKMFEIIEYVISRCDDSILENNEIEKMFVTFVTRRVSNIESEILFDLILSTNKYSRSYDQSYLFSFSNKKYIFKTWMCKKDYVTPYDYDAKSFRWFKDLFLAINEEK